LLPFYFRSASTGPNLKYASAGEKSSNGQYQRTDTSGSQPEISMTIVKISKVKDYQTTAPFIQVLDKAASRDILELIIHQNKEKYPDQGEG
jgi:hypothetical protein